MRRFLVLGVVSLVGYGTGCGDSSAEGDTAYDGPFTTLPPGTETGEDMSTTNSSASTTAGMDTGTDTDGTADTSDDSGTKFDMAPVPEGGGEPPPPSCKVVDEMDAVGDCMESAPARQLRARRCSGPAGARTATTSRSSRRWSPT